MRNYEAGTFASLYRTPQGQELWAFLNEPETVIRMETATVLGRPAVEGIEEPLLRRFGQAILDDRMKQMCGSMVRQVMEPSGFEIGVQNTKINNGAPFTSGTKYRRRDDMLLYSFRNASDPRLFAVVQSRHGAGLPADQGKWSYWKPVKGALRISVLTGRPIDRVKRALAEDGYRTYRLERVLRAG